MNLPHEAPKLPLAPFLVGDAALIATAVFVGRTCAAPIGPWPLLAISLCVITGAVLAAIPFVVNYAKRQDAELSERQNQIAALARITAESAEQLSIAAASLHGIAEASSGNLKLIEQLPAQLQDHVKNLQKHLGETAKSASSASKDESAHIDDASERITKAVADLAKLETSTRQHLTAVNHALANFSSNSEKTSSKAGQQVAAAVSASLADFELHLAAAVTRATAQAEHVIAELPRRKRAKQVPDETPATEETLAAEPPPPAPAPVEESVVVTPTEEEPIVTAPSIEPDPAPAPSTEETLSTSADPSPEDVPVSEPAKPRAARQPKPTEDSGFHLGLSVEASENESSITSDGFTRLIATAYIGIGNKLFIRGEGPGLSWDKGVALQFVSIGKWRWETADATSPIQAKLYKNDQTECTATGTITLEPGRQHEINAGF
jgi:hypothetical protein